MGIQQKDEEMEGVYLSQRHQKKDGSFKLYAVHNIWVPEEPDPKIVMKSRASPSMMKTRE